MKLELEMLDVDYEKYKEYIRKDISLCEFLATEFSCAYCAENVYDEDPCHTCPLDNRITIKEVKHE